MLLFLLFWISTWKGHKHDQKTNANYKIHRLHVCSNFEILIFFCRFCLFLFHRLSNVHPNGVLLQYIIKPFIAYILIPSNAIRAQYNSICYLLYMKTISVYVVNTRLHCIKESLVTVFKNIRRQKFEKVNCPLQHIGDNNDSYSAAPRKCSCFMKFLIWHDIVRFGSRKAE